MTDSYLCTLCKYDGRAQSKSMTTRSKSIAAEEEVPAKDEKVVAVPEEEPRAIDTKLRTVPLDVEELFASGSLVSKDSSAGPVFKFSNRSA